MGVPLPTTGSWSGAALASIFKMRVVESLLGIFIGNAIAGAIMLGVSLHVSEGISIELLIISILTIVATLYIIKQKKLNKEM